MLVKHGRLDFLIQWVWGKAQKSSYLYAPQVQVRVGSPGIGSRTTLWEPSVFPSCPFLIGASSLLMFWELLLLCVCVCIISINFVLRKRGAKVKQWGADCVRTPHLRDSPSPILGRFQDRLEDWGVGQPTSFQGWGWEGGEVREGERAEMPGGWNADARTSDPQWPASWNCSFPRVERPVQPVSGLLNPSDTLKILIQCLHL